MAEGLIDSIILRDAIEKEFGFLVENLDEIAAKLKNFPQIKSLFQNDSNIKKVVQGHQELNHEMDQYKKLQDQVSAVATKLNTLQERYGKLLADYRDRLKEVNKETKTQADEADRVEKAKAKVAQSTSKEAKEEAFYSQQLKENKKNLRDQAELENAVAKSREEAAAKVKLLRSQLDILADPEGKNKAKADELRKQIDELGNFLERTSDKFAKRKINVGNYTESAQIIVDAFERSRSKLVQVEQQFGKASPEAQAARREFDALNRITQDKQFLNVAGRLGEGRTEIEFLTRQLIDLRQKGLESSDVFKIIQERVAELTKEVRETKAEVQALSSQTRTFDLFAGSVSTVASIFESAAGAAALFGEESQEAVQTIRKVVAIQALANGVREIARQVQEKQTAAGKAFNFVVENTGIAFGKSASAAQRFNAILKLGIAGAIITGLIFLIANFNKLSGETKKLENGLKDLEGVSAGTKAALKEFGDSVEKVAKGVNEDLRSSIKSLNDELGLSPSKLDVARAAIQLLSNEIQNLEDKAKSNEKSFGKFFGTLANGLELLHSKIATAKKELGELLPNAEKLDQLQRQKDVNEAVKLKRQQAIAEFELEIDLNQRVLNNDRATLKQRENALQTIFDRRKKIIKEQLDQEIKDANHNSTLINAAQEKAARERTKAERDLNEQLQKVRDQFHDREQAAQFKIISTEKQFQIESAKEIAENEKNSGVERLANAQIFFIESKKLIEAEARFEKEKRGLTAKEVEQIETDKYFKLAKLNENYAKLSAKIISDNFPNVGTLKDLVTKLDEVASKMGQKALDQATKRMEAWKQLDEEHIKVIENLRQAYQFLADTIGSSLGEVISGTFDAKKNQIQDQIDDIERLKAAEIDRIEKSGDSQEKKAARIKIVEAKAQADRETLERRQRELDRRKAFFERGFRAFQITTDGIKSVQQITIAANEAYARTLAAFGWPAGVGPATAARADVMRQLFPTIASTATQLAALFATPIPKFAEGGTVEKTQPIILGEAGRELAISPTGRLTLYEKPTFTLMNAGTKILSNKITESILSSSYKNQREILEKSQTVDMISIVTKDDRIEDVITELKELNKKPTQFIIHNEPGIESTAWFWNNLKY